MNILSEINNMNNLSNPSIIDLIIKNIQDKQVASEESHIVIPDLEKLKQIIRVEEQLKLKQKELHNINHKIRNKRFLNNNNNNNNNANSVPTIVININNNPGEKKELLEDKKPVLEDKLLEETPLFEDKKPIIKKELLEYETPSIKKDLFQYETPIIKKDLFQEETHIIKKDLFQDETPPIKKDLFQDETPIIKKELLEDTLLDEKSKDFIPSQTLVKPFISKEDISKPLNQDRIKPIQSSINKPLVKPDTVNPSLSQITNPIKPALSQTNNPIKPALSQNQPISKPLINQTNNQIKPALSQPINQIKPSLSQTNNPIKPSINPSLNQPLVKPSLSQPINQISPSSSQPINQINPSLSQSTTQNVNTSQQKPIFSNPSLQALFEKDREQSIERKREEPLRERRNPMSFFGENDRDYSSRFNDRDYSPRDYSSRFSSSQFNDPYFSQFDNPYRRNENMFYDDEIIKKGEDKTKKIKQLIEKNKKEKDYYEEYKKKDADEKLKLVDALTNINTYLTGLNTKVTGFDVQSVLKDQEKILENIKKINKDLEGVSKKASSSSSFSKSIAPSKKEEKTYTNLDSVLEEDRKKFNGLGQITLQNGVIQRGTLKKGDFDLKQELEIELNDVIIKGVFNVGDNLPTGKGTITFKDGPSKGTFESDEFNGNSTLVTIKGIMSYSNSSSPDEKGELNLNDRKFTPDSKSPGPTNKEIICNNCAFENYPNTKECAGCRADLLSQ